VQSFLPNSINYLFNREVGGFWVFAVEEGCSDPDLIGDLDAAKHVTLHNAPARDGIYIATKYCS